MSAKGNLTERPGMIRLNRRGEFTLVSALVEALGHEPVGLLVEHGVNGLLDDFPGQLTKLEPHRFSSSNDTIGLDVVCLLVWLNSTPKSYRRHVSCPSLFWVCSTFKMRKEFYVATLSTFDNTWAISGRRYLAIFRDRRQVSAFAVVHKRLEFYGRGGCE